MIQFKTPGQECRLFINKINPKTTESEVLSMFNLYGLLYDFKLFSKESRPYLYAFATYYSRFAATNAQNQLNRHSFHGTTITVMFADQLKKTNSETGKTYNERPPRQLTLSKSIEVINHFVGFDGWISGVQILAPIEEIQKVPGTTHYKGTYKCIVRFSFKKDEISLDAIGYGTQEGNDMNMVIEYGKKKAVTDAYKTAFSQMALVVLRSNKVAIHFLEMDINTYWRKPEVTG